MSQCKKILSQGQQCSNQAVPGTDYCSKHKRQFVFRPIQPKSQSDTTSPPSDPHVQIPMPSQPGSSPNFPNLTLDKRDILIAPSGVIFLSSPKNKTLNSILHPVIAAISHIMPLSPHVTIKTLNASDCLIFITPMQTKPDYMSVFYDALSDITQNYSDPDRQYYAILLIGNKNLYIQYRDHNAPRGYDARMSSPPEQEIILIHSAKQYTFKQNDLTDVPLQNILLSMRPKLSSISHLPETVYLIAPVPLYPILSRYLTTRKLTFQVARCLLDNGTPILIFELTPRFPADHVTHMPKFLIQALGDLPDCHVFLQPVYHSTQKIFVEYGYEFICPIPHIQNALADHQLIFFFGQKPPVCLSPVPVFLNGDALMRIQITQSKPIMVQSDQKLSIQNLSIPLRLVYDTRGGSTAYALIIKHEECQWFIKTLYLLPERLIQSMTVFWGQSLIVVQARDLSLPLFPFGMPMQPVFNSHLFIPLHTRMMPSLAWEAVQNALNLTSTHYTFLTPDFRLDCPMNDWVPLSRHVSADLNTPNVQQTLKQTPMPKLQWTAPKQPKQASPKNKRSIINSTKRTDPPPNQVSVPTVVEQASVCESKNDLLMAGMYYFMGGEAIKASQCIEKSMVRFK